MYVYTQDVLHEREEEKTHFGGGGGLGYTGEMVILLYTRLGFMIVCPAVKQRRPTRRLLLPDRY